MQCRQDLLITFHTLIRISIMGKYIPVFLTLSAGQKQKLRGLRAIQLKPGDMYSGGKRGPGVMVHVTAAQRRKIHNRLSSNANRAFNKKRGLRITLSRSQLYHNMKHGSGIFDTLKNGVKSLVHNSTVQDFAKKGFHAALDYGKQKYLPMAKDYAQNKMSALVNRVAGKGIKKRKGKGLFSSIAQAALPIVAQAGINKLLGGKGIRAPGNGIQAPGGKVKKGKGCWARMADGSIVGGGISAPGGLIQGVDY